MTTVAWKYVLVRILFILLVFFTIIIHNKSSVAFNIKPGQHELLVSPETTFNKSEKDITMKKDGEGVAVAMESGNLMSFH